MVVLVLFFLNSYLPSKEVKTPGHLSLTFTSLSVIGNLYSESVLQLKCFTMWLTRVGLGTIKQLSGGGPTSAHSMQ